MRKKSNNIFYGGKSECGPALQLNSASHRVRTSSVLCKFTKCVCLVTSNSSVTLWPTPVRLPYLSMGFFRQEYWSGLPFPPPGDLPVPRIKPRSPVSPALQADPLPLSPGEAQGSK